MQVVEGDEDAFEKIFAHRHAAKESYINRSYDDDPMNNSSFNNLDVDDDKAQLLYSKSSERDRKELWQFQMISLVGRGTFGKVFLVFLPTS